MTIDSQQAVDVFNKVESTLMRLPHSGFDQRSRHRSAKHFSDMLRAFRTDSDDKFFFRMTMIVFYSGFRASTVSRRESTLFRHFKSFRRVAAYTRKDITRILNDPKMIAHRNKVTSLVSNAKQFIKVIKQHGSFRNYLLSFNSSFPQSDQGLDDLRDDLMARFAYLGPATVNHFLTDYAFPVVKPDRMVMRVLHRSHLVAGESVHYYDDAIKLCKLISERLGIPIRYVDSVLVSLGQVDEANICSKSKPRCKECDLEKVCKFSK